MKLDFVFGTEEDYQRGLREIHFNSLPIEDLTDLHYYNEGLKRIIREIYHGGLHKWQGEIS